jgi:predicted Rossmann-fold nucleotide-binding protein
VNGATTGLPLVAAKEARRHGSQIIAVSPAVDLTQHLQLFDFPEYLREELVFAGFEANMAWMKLVERFITKFPPDEREKRKRQYFLKYRNPISVGMSDAVIAMGGRIGTINELTIASDFGIPIGIVREGGGTAELFPEIVRQSGKQKALVLVLPPKELVDKILKHLEE